MAVPQLSHLGSSLTSLGSLVEIFTVTDAVTLRLAGPPYDVIHDCRSSVAVAGRRRHGRSVRVAASALVLLRSASSSSNDSLCPEFPALVTRAYCYGDGADTQYRLVR
eukprot:FR743958.1.p2 GENE.FR743958.1~~FR743958.1.p2  ORF type:complete len:108 (+),score=5.07 FR743958.1:1238-1561(+)